MLKCALHMRTRAARAWGVPCRFLGKIENLGIAKILVRGLARLVFNARNKLVLGLFYFQFRALNIPCYPTIVFLSISRAFTYSFGFTPFLTYRII